jgi:hypothetical protein
MTQLNTPYPATAYLTGFLRMKGYNCAQSDPAIELVLRLFSRGGLKRILAEITARKKTKQSSVDPFTGYFIEAFDGYSAAIDPTIRFLQGKDPSMALRIASREFLPEGPRFMAIDQMEEAGSGDLGWAFGSLGVQDRSALRALPLWRKACGECSNV